jgi:hypothetical protein
MTVVGLSARWMWRWAAGAMRDLLCGRIAHCDGRRALRVPMRGDVAPLGADQRSQDEIAGGASGAARFARH